MQLGGLGCRASALAHLKIDQAKTARVRRFWLPAQEREKNWCGRWESNPHEEKSPEDFHAVYGFRRPDADALQHSRPVCGLDYPFTLPQKIRGLGAARLVSTPSRMDFLPGLARDCHYRFPRI